MLISIYIRIVTNTLWSIKKKFFDKASQYAKISIKYSEMAELNAFKARALGVENEVQE